MAIGDITGTSGLHFLLAVNRMKGGSYDDMDSGFAALHALLPNAVVLYTQADQLVSLFQRGEVVIAPWYPDRAGSAIDAGVKVAVAYPKEGAVGIKPVLVIPKGAPHPDLALKYIDTVLSVPGQSCFAEHKYAGAGEPEGHAVRQGRCPGAVRCRPIRRCGIPTRPRSRNICRTGRGAGSAKWSR